MRKDDKRRSRELAVYEAVLAYQKDPAGALAKGLLKPGGTIVEATAGNTGLGIAFAALNKGYHIIFVVPTKFSK